MRYQRLLPLGSGGMANVHLALALGQGGFKRLVVVKSVRDELVADPAMRQMFLAEARLSARLNHPNVVQVSEVVEAADGGVMLVMEYLDGQPLSGVYRSLGDAFTLPMRLRVLCEVLAGLQYAHDLADYHGNPLGIVHRDVSPQNVFITYDARVKLLDFGIAKVAASEDKTRTGVIKGRIAYMPFEQVTGKGVDRRADVYAIGCLLWEAVASQRMWGQLTEPQLVRELVRGNIPRLGEHVQVDPELDRIVTRATAPLPQDRYEGAEALRRDLERYLQTLPAVSLRDMGELLSRTCSQSRSERQRELAAAVAATDRDVASLLDVESSRGMRALSPDGTSSGISGVASRPRMLRSFSPTPAPYFLTPAGATPAAPDSRRGVDNTKSSSVSVQLQPPRRRGFWLVLAGAAGLALAAWLPSMLRPTASAPASAAQALSAAAPPASPVTVAPTDSAMAVDEPEVPSASPSGSSAPKRKGHARWVAPPTAAAAAPKAKPAAGCDPPYYFSAGIKTYKPECI
ncbi:MAG: serine/threonine protein kinase [Polyangiaceae bacterium]|jgi:serine/threonine-protein kinase|nr:serine/threonine protein kinase [Polyangiaceae bacterium]